MEGWQGFESDHSALQRIMAILWAMAGLGGRDTILRSVHRVVTRLLRPAEAATRRLIVVLARDLAVTLPQPRLAAPRPERLRRQAYWMPFPLSDPMPHFLDQSEARRPFPAILVGRGDPEISGARLAQRIDALCFALDDLQAQAQRLARWQARRKRAQARGAFCTTQPLRPGPPQDLRGCAARRLRKHELFGILKGAHERAWWSQNEERVVKRTKSQGFGFSSGKRPEP